jgi:hypothetical protein
MLRLKAKLQIFIFTVISRQLLSTFDHVKKRNYLSSAALPRQGNTMCSFHSGYISLVQPTESSTKSLVVTRYGGFYGHRLQYFMMKRPTSRER